MPAEIESLEEARRARRGDPPSPSAVGAANRYIDRAEEALRLLAELTHAAERRAVCQITEIWLSLAEVTLRPSPAR